MMEQFTLKSVARYFLGASFLVLIFAWFPSTRYSLSLTYLSVFAVIAGSLCGVIAIRRGSVLLRVAYLLNPPLLFYLVTLRMWDKAAGLSWVFILTSLAGVAGIGLFPYVNKRLSGILYREQLAPRTKLGAWIFLSLQGILFMFLVVGAVSIILSFYVGKEPNKDVFTPLLVALLFYLLTLDIVFLVMYRHANCLYMWNMPSKGGTNDV